MKKIKHLLMFFSLLYLENLSATCLCAGEIQKIYTQVEQYISKTNIIPTVQNIQNELIPQIQVNNQSINTQNEELEKILKSEKLKALETKELIFLLEKLYKIESIN